MRIPLEYVGSGIIDVFIDMNIGAGKIGLKCQ